MKKKPLIKVENVSKSFITSERQELLVLDSLNFSMREGEIVALLGKSGSGKSTLLRIVAGLIPPTKGTVHFKDELINAPVQGIAMVFQSFALLPWLTVLENVELGLEAQGIPKKERRQRAIQAIDTIGLDGFESAYPKELSGGMRQRVGFARALVVEPELLIMDEPFSALDILTAENLRNDLLNLWQEKQTNIKGILCVTHDIEEAILMADRIVIFASNPGRIQTQLKVDLPYPRDPQSPKFRKLLNKIYMSLTSSERDRLARAKITAVTTEEQKVEYSYRVPEVDVSELTGLLESMEAHEIDGHIDLATLAEELHLDVNDIFPLTEVLDMLRFAKITDGELRFTEVGKKFANTDILERKQIFKQQLMNYIPLVKHIRETLDTTSNHRASEDYFLTELENNFSEDESERILKTIIDWGRYAELFAYDYSSGDLSLENPE
jgi:NitT/TauT family transport system ATP-binding protein